MDDEFDVWLGTMGKQRPMRHDMRRAVNQAGGSGRSARRAKPRFTGARTGRGKIPGGLLASRVGTRGDRARRVIVKARFVKLAGKGAKAAAAHLRYLERDGTTREGERGHLYGPDDDHADGKAFLERGAGDRHQFRFIVSPEDGEQYDDLKSVTRRLMTQMEADLGTRLDWVAVDHFNTGHPHTHIVLRGADEQDKSLVIARDYISQGIAARACEIVERDLGPRSEHEIAASSQREVTQERFTRIDRRLLQDIDEKGLASAWHADPVEQGLRAARLSTLSRMGLATEKGKGLYRLDPELEPSLRAMGRRGDIIATMHEQLRSRPEVRPQDYAIYDRSENLPIVGKVLARGLSDELRDRHYLIVEATDGRSHYVDLGNDLADGVMKDRLVQVSPSAFGIRKVDRTIVEVAAANGGMYSERLHLQHDPSANYRLAEAHERRLEALRRGGELAPRRVDGSWEIGPDHLEKVARYEQRLALQTPVVVAVLADRPLEQLAFHDGPTWLDRQSMATEPSRLDGRMGAEVKRALQLRQQWLVEQGLAELNGDTVRYRANMLATLRQRELRRVAGQLSQELGLNFAPMQGSSPIEGTYRKAVQVGSEKFAVIEKSKEFTLVPWRPVLEKHIGKQVSGGIEPGGAINWRFGRQRSGPEIS
ncbi:relaxase/mobilization nuclease RlxS [Novosphingobium kaempferiae]|uniref:relaxase/mobilization nuclease RlxS n=1 Tax=Novosphingobium kaempferiae TaxID=2896849 RepID=UPI001E52CE04|nr:relaxase/mobilization nuclease RlxS [Novosphingobium kaempferiae]